LVRANFVESSLVDVGFQKSDLTEANLSNAALHGARLAGAVLVGADLRGATLASATLYGADLRRANLEGTTFTSGFYHGQDAAHYDSSTIWPEGFDPVAVGAVNDDEGELPPSVRAFDQIDPGTGGDRTDGEPAAGADP